MIAFFLFIYFASAHQNLEHRHHHIEDWMENPTKEIKSCLSPDLEHEEKQTCRFFAAVIDAGSTGSRLHLFEFIHDPTHEHSPFKLESETFKQTTPGLSSYATEPEKAAESIKGLIDHARTKVPKELWSHTPIYVKATAGLRLLPAEQADNILIEVEAVVQRSGLLIEDEAVGILSGTDEGVFGWFTLNFLVDQLKYLQSRVTKSAVALDLGGGSTQITFIPKNPDAIFTESANEDEFGHTLKVFGQKLRLYTHSYLGNGLIAARLGINKLLEPSEDTLNSYCLPEGYLLKDWDYAGNNWAILGSSDASFTNCLDLAKKYVQKTNVQSVNGELNDRDIYVFAYFFDRAEQAGLTQGEDQAGKWIKVRDYKNEAVKACARSSDQLGPEHWRPWQCLDLSYIYALLSHGYGLKDDTKVHVSKKIKKMEVSWALGAGYHLLNTYHEKSTLPSPPSVVDQTCNRENCTGNNTYMNQIYEYITMKATEILVVLRILS